MSLKKKLQSYYIKINRYLLKRKYLRIMDGPLKGYWWSTAYNYDYLTGDYEDLETLQLFLSWLKPGSVFYDLGANVGYYAFIANRVIESGNIYSAEPIPENISVYRTHLELNKSRMPHQNIHLLTCAISDDEKEVYFSNDQSRIEGNTYVGHNANGHVPGSQLLVQCHSVDGLVNKGYPAPDVIKIDVEGAEFDVLRGARETLRSYKPKILLATHDYHLPGVQQQCKDFLINLGYSLMVVPGHNKIYAGLDDYIAIHPDNP